MYGMAMEAQTTPLASRVSRTPGILWRTAKMRTVAVAAISTEHPLVQSSTMGKMHRQRPSRNWSEAKSTDQRRLGARGTIIGTGFPRPVCARRDGAHRAASISETLARLGQGSQAIPLCGVAQTPKTVPTDHPRTVEYFARPPFAHLECKMQTSGSLSLGGERYHFFDSRSFSAALPSIALAAEIMSKRL
jgi:hypothetical protein